MGEPPTNITYNNKKMSPTEFSENILQRDIDNLLSGNAKKYLGITNKL